MAKMGAGQLSRNMMLRSNVVLKITQVLRQQDVMLSSSDLLIMMSSNKSDKNWNMATAIFTALAWDICIYADALVGRSSLCDEVM